VSLRLVQGKRVAGELIRVAGRLHVLFLHVVFLVICARSAQGHRGRYSVPARRSLARCNVSSVSANVCIRRFSPQFGSENTNMFHGRPGHRRCSPFWYFLALFKDRLNRLRVIHKVQARMNSIATPSMMVRAFRPDNVQYPDRTGVCPASPSWMSTVSWTERGDVLPSRK